MLSARAKGAVNSTLTRGRRRRADDRRHRRAHPRPARLVRPARPAPAPHDRRSIPPTRSGSSRSPVPPLLARLAEEGLLRRQRRSPPARSLRSGWASSPARGRRPRPTSSTSCGGAGSPSTCCAPTRRVQGHDAPRRSRPPSGCSATHRLDVLARRARRRRPHRPGRLRRRSGGPGHRRLPGAGAHRRRPRGRHAPWPTRSPTPPPRRRRRARQLLVARVGALRRRARRGLGGDRRPRRAGRGRPRRPPGRSRPAPLAERPGGAGPQRRPAGRGRRPLAPRVARRASTRPAAGSTATAAG